MSPDEPIEQDETKNDIRVAALILDVMKRLEINLDRLPYLRQKIECIHSRLQNVQSNNISKQRKEKDNEANEIPIQDMMHALEDQRKILRNLQR